MQNTLFQAQPDQASETLNKNYKEFEEFLKIQSQNIIEMRQQLETLEKSLWINHSRITFSIQQRSQQLQTGDQQNFNLNQLDEEFKKEQIKHTNNLKQQIDDYQHKVKTFFTNSNKNDDTIHVQNVNKENLSEDSEQSADYDNQEEQSQDTESIDDELQNLYNQAYDILENENNIQQNAQQIQQNVEILQLHQPNPQDIIVQNMRIRHLIEIRPNIIIATTKHRIHLIHNNDNVEHPNFQEPNTFQQYRYKITSLSKYQVDDQYKFIIALNNGKIEIWTSENEQLMYVQYYQLTTAIGRLLITLSTNVLVTIGGDRRMRLFYPEINPHFGIASIVLLREQPVCLCANLINPAFQGIAVAGRACLTVIINNEEIIRLGQVNKRDQVKFMRLQNDRKLIVVFEKSILIYEYQETEQTYNRIQKFRFQNSIVFCNFFENNNLVISTRTIQGNQQNGYINYEARIFQNQLLQIRQEVLDNQKIRLVKIQNENQLIMKWFRIQGLRVNSESLNSLL